MKAITNRCSTPLWVTTMSWLHGYVPDGQGMPNLKQGIKITSFQCDRVGYLNIQCGLGEEFLINVGLI